MTEHSIEEQRRQLQEIRDSLKAQKDLFKPMFGLMFWELAAVEKQMSFEDIQKETLSLTMQGEEDESLGMLLGIYFQIWSSAKDFNGASRFIADSLGLSADELLQSKIIFDSRK